MGVIKQSLTDPVTYRRLAYLLSALVLGPIWFVALVTVWSLALGLIVTPFVIPVLIVLAYMTRGLAALEAEIARSLLEVEAQAPSGAGSRPGFWGWFRGLFSGDFWRAQAYLMLRWFAGFPVGLVIVTVIAGGVALVFAPAWVPFTQGGAHLGFWRPHTFLQSLALVPAGLVLAPAGVLMAKPVAVPFGPVATALLTGPAWRGAAILGSAPLGTGAGVRRAGPPVEPGHALEIHGAVDAIVALTLVLIWAVTSRGYFWPIWVLLPLAVTLGIHGWLVLVGEDPAIVRRFRGSRTLAASVGLGVLLAAFFTGVWAAAGTGYFWPVWPILAIAIVLAAELASVLLTSPRRAEMAERIETLESTRAGAVDAQETELRRIERDLHDGAQARLVALGMSLGMAEQKLSEDPQRAGELLAEARAGAEHALRELRDLARGIHPPVLADRGLEAALASLASSTPLRVGLSVDVTPRPAPAVETAAYFVAAEALTNAAKHARADRVDITVIRHGDRIELEVRDDGQGGADPNGAGLRGLRRRVEALDGRLSVSSPRGGPTTIYAELPCG